MMRRLFKRLAMVLCALSVFAVAPYAAQAQADEAANPESQVAPSNVYQWRDTPVNRLIPVYRAVFDQTGYRIFAQTGEIIVVPFVNQNLYPLKFGLSPDNRMYFYNEGGSVPTLYLPSGGYLTSGVAEEVRWYPFSNNFNYSRPVYIGVAPSWEEYLAMGWYPGMVIRGGYWSGNAWRPGYSYPIMIGTGILVGGRAYYTWDSYQVYYRTVTSQRTVIAPPPANGNNGALGRRQGIPDNSGNTRNEPAGRYEGPAVPAARGSYRTAPNANGGNNNYLEPPTQAGAMGGINRSVGAGFPGNAGGGRNAPAIPRSVAPGRNPRYQEISHPLNPGATRQVPPVNRLPARPMNRNGGVPRNMGSPGGRSFHAGAAGRRP